MRLVVILLIYILVVIISIITVNATVKYDEGRIEIDGIQLLQDSDNANAYYYIPPYPRISTLTNGDFEFFCAKYIGVNGIQGSGGLFHVLIQFSLTPEETTALAQKLKETHPKAVLMGPVPMSVDDSGNTAASFRIVSSILTDTKNNQFTSSLVTSGRAPLLPGSKAAIAAHLTPEGVTLLWESFRGVASDVSVVVDGYYQAKLKAYKATVQADLSLVYEHLSTYNNTQSGFSKNQISSILDSLSQAGTIKIDVADLSSGKEIDTKVYQNILTIVTDKVVDAMFNVKNGWAKVPVSEKPIEPTDPKDRYQRGAFVRFFAGDGTQEYIPDDAFLLKKKTEIRNFSFYLDLTHSTVVNVPIHSAGNIRGFYNEYKDDKKYFRIIDMNDPDFQMRDVHFQVDGDFIGAFGDIVDQVSVLLQKDYPAGVADSYSGTLLFNKPGIDSGNFTQSLSYMRLGDRGNDWLKYKYKVGWKFIGIDSLITTPAKDWIIADIPSISIRPPLQKTTIEIGVDKQLLKERGIQSIRIRFASILFNKPYKGKMMVIRPNEPAESVKAIVYHDPGRSIVYQVNWYSNKGEIQDDLLMLEDDYVFLIPPEKK